MARQWATDEHPNFRRIRFKLEEIGFDEIRQLNNHAKFVRRNGAEINTVIMPHYQDISPSVLRSILRQAGITREEFDAIKTWC